MVVLFGRTVSFIGNTYKFLGLWVIVLASFKCFRKTDLFELYLGLFYKFEICIKLVIPENKKVVHSRMCLVVKTHEAGSWLSHRELWSVFRWLSKEKAEPIATSPRTSALFKNMKLVLKCICFMYQITYKRSLKIIKSILIILFKT